MPLTPETWLDQFTVNSTTTSSQSDQQITQLANGDILVTWTSAAATGAASPNGLDIIGQRYDVLGNPIGGEFLVNTFQINDEYNSAIVGLAGGGFAMAYLDRMGSTYDIRIEEYSNSSVSDGVVTIASLGTNFAGDVTIASSSASSIFVGWDEFTGTSDAYRFSIYNSSTNTSTAPATLFELTSSSLGAISNIDVATLSNGSDVAVAQFNPDGTDNSTIRYEIVSESGIPSGSLAVPTTIDNGFDDTDPQITALTGGGFVIAWSNTDLDDTDVFFQRFDDAGNTVGNATTVNDGALTDDNNEVEVVALSDGGFIVFYDDDEVNSSIGKRYDSGGSAVGSSFTLDTTNANNIRAVLLEDGRVAVTWLDGEVQMKILDDRDAPNGGGDYSPDQIQVGTIGSDSFTMAFGVDFAYGYDGNDRITGGSSADRIFGGNGNDVLIGGSGSDSLLGLDDDDILFGGAGDDSLQGGSGNDQLNGGAGADTIDGGDGQDLVSYFSSDAAINFNFATLAAFGGHADGDILSNIEGAVGSLFDDTMISDASDNTFYGADGNDRLFGQGGNDRLYGQGGADQINAGTGNDTIDGGDGIDRLVYDIAGFGYDRIQNYDAAGNDYLDFRGSGLSQSDLTLEQNGADVVARFTGNSGSNIIFEDMTVASLDTSDWLF